MSNESIVAWLLLTIGAIIVGYLIFKAVEKEKAEIRSEAETFWFNHDNKKNY